MSKIFLKKTFRYTLSTLILFLFALILPNALFASENQYSLDNLEPQNGIPLLIIRVDETDATINDMNSSYDHSLKLTNGTAEIKVPEDFNGGYKDDNENTNTNNSSLSNKVNILTNGTTGELLLDYIRGRGNTTWTNNKKPYKIQLKNAYNFFNMGASKDWALLANSMDPSFIRNRITSWLGEEMGLAFTPRMVPVDLVMIGSVTGLHLYGTYVLSETIKIEESRINIHKLKKNDIENITGGYIFSPCTSQDDDKPASTKFRTNYGLELLNDTPEFDDSLTEAQILQRNYSRKFIQELEDIILGADEIDETVHNEIAKRLDLRSLADYWLIQEIAFNSDGFVTSSTYFYKDRDDKLFFGPLWDFDVAWGVVDSGSEVKRSFNSTIMPWVDKLRGKDPLFVSLIKERFLIFNEKLNELTREAGIIDQFKAQLQNSVQADYDIWKDGNNIAGNYHGIEDYNASIEALKGWIKERTIWANNDVEKISKVFFKVNYEVNNEVVATEEVRYDETPKLDLDVPTDEGHVFKNWKDKVYGRSLRSLKIRKDETVIPDFIEASGAIAPQELAFIDASFDAFINEEFFDLQEISYVMPFDATNQRITFTSSNENVGVIDPVNHRVVLKGIGETTITGTLYNGTHSSFLLNVKESSIPYPVIIDFKEVNLSQDELVYDGNVKKPTVLKIDGKEVVEEVDFTASYSDASSKNVGTYSVTIKGKGNYVGTTSASYKIVPKKITLPSGNVFTYDGSLKVGVEENENYSVTVGSAKDAGSYIAKLSLKDKENLRWEDNTTNDKEVLWEILKAQNPLSVKAKSILIKYKKLKQRNQVLAPTKVILFKKEGEGTLAFKKLLGDGKIKINKKSGKVILKKGLLKGDYKVKIRVKAFGNDNYNPSEAFKVIFNVQVK